MTSLAVPPARDNDGNGSDDKAKALRLAIDGHIDALAESRR